MSSRYGVEMAGWLGLQIYLRAPPPSSRARLARTIRLTSSQHSQHLSASASDSTPGSKGCSVGEYSTKANTKTPREDASIRSHVGLCKHMKPGGTLTLAASASAPRDEISCSGLSDKFHTQADCKGVKLSHSLASYSLQTTSVVNGKNLVSTIHWRTGEDLMMQSVRLS